MRVVPRREPRNERFAGTREQVREARVHHRPTSWPPPEPRYPEWGWFPEGAWWRTWWDLEKGHLGEDDEYALDVLNTIVCPQWDAMQAFGMLIAESKYDSPWPVAWVQNDTFPRADGKPYDHILGGPTSWSAHCDTSSCGSRHDLNPVRDVQESFISALRSSGRCTHGMADIRAAVFGLADLTEARAVADLLVGLAWGRKETALNCIAQLARSGAK